MINHRQLRNEPFSSDNLKSVDFMHDISSIEWPKLAALKICRAIVDQSRASGDARVLLSISDTRKNAQVVTNQQQTCYKIVHRT